MQKPSTTKFQRIAIWSIAIILAVGTLGGYFLIMLQSDSSQQATTTPTEAIKKEEQVDPTAHKVEGKVTQLQVIDEKAGTGEAVKATDTVKVHYKGTIAQTGVKFDSSYDRGEPAIFGLQQVIPGFSQGLVGMQAGGKRQIIIPSDLGYGAEGSVAIPANSDLVFEVELIAINPVQ